MKGQADEQDYLKAILDNLIAMGSPLGPNLAALAALSLTPFGQSLLELANEQAGPWNGSYIEVDVTPAQLLDIDNNNVPLLPYPGANKYYRNVYMLWEFTGGTVAFDFGPGETISINWQNGTAAFIDCQLFAAGSGVKYVAEVFCNNGQITGGLNMSSIFQITGSFPVFNFYTTGGTAPSVGNGTLKVKIWYKEETFG